MPRRELRHGRQVAEWLQALGASLSTPGDMTLIGSAALLWHADHRGVQTELPDPSMDVDPVTESEEVAMHCYEALIGSEFERIHGWHVNLMPGSILRELPVGWEQRATVECIGKLTLTVPSPADLLAPKLRRNCLMFINGIHLQEYAKLEYGRLLWRRPDCRARLLSHWNDSRHPHAGRFAHWAPEIERILSSPKGSDTELDGDLRQRGLSLRVVVKEIPSVFGSFWKDSAA